MSIIETRETSSVQITVSIAVVSDRRISQVIVRMNLVSEVVEVTWISVSPVCVVVSSAVWAIVVEG